MRKGVEEAQRQLSQASTVLRILLASEEKLTEEPIEVQYIQVGSQHIVEKGAIAFRPRGSSEILYFDEEETLDSGCMPSAYTPGGSVQFRDRESGELVELAPGEWLVQATQPIKISGAVTGTTSIRTHAVRGELLFLEGGTIRKTIDFTLPVTDPATWAPLKDRVSGRAPRMLLVGEAFSTSSRHLYDLVYGCYSSRLCRSENGGD